MKPLSMFSCVSVFLTHSYFESRHNGKRGISISGRCGKGICFSQRTLIFTNIVVINFLLKNQLDKLAKRLILRIFKGFQAIQLIIIKGVKQISHTNS